MEDYFLNAIERSPIVVHPPVETLYFRQQQRHLLLQQLLRQEWESIYAIAKQNPTLLLLSEERFMSVSPQSVQCTALFLALHHAHPKDLFFLGSSFSSQLSRAQQYDALQALNIFMQNLAPFFDVSDPLQMKECAPLESRICSFFKGYVLSEDHLLTSPMRALPIWHLYEGRAKEFSSTFGANSLIGSELLCFAFWGNHQSNAHSFDLMMGVNRFFYNFLVSTFLHIKSNISGGVQSDEEEQVKQLFYQALTPQEDLLGKMRLVFNDALGSEHIEQHFWIQALLPFLSQVVEKKLPTLIKYLIQKVPSLKQSSQYQITKLLYEMPQLTALQVRVLESLRDAII